MPAPAAIPRQPERLSSTATAGRAGQDTGTPLGDDLPRARRFCDMARAQMDAIIAAARDAETDPGRDPHWLAGRLCAIQQGAKRARARAVYRSAQTATNLLHRAGPHMPIDWGQVDGGLLALNKLITQYEAGLREVEDLLAGAPAPARRTNGVGGTPRRNARAQCEAATATLRGVLPLSRGAETQALERLLRAAGPSAPPAPQSVPTVALADALPDLVQRLLGHGREYGKMVSVSHTLDGVGLPEAARAQVVDRLWEALRPLVEASLPLQGVGHIDIAQRDPSSLHVSGSGFAPFDVPLSQGMAAGPVPSRPLPRPVPAPRITPDTEDALRAQLAALLDGGAP